MTCRCFATILKHFHIIGDESEELSRRRSKIKEPSRSSANAIFFGAHWLLPTLATLLVFLVFIMRAYAIPTGSMADTLRGAHFRLRCAQCGYKYNYGFDPQHYKLPESYVPRKAIIIKPSPPRCCVCGFFFDADERVSVTKGDQIFVFKPLYSFIDPKRWDVAVFKSPIQPTINFIKRMIGLPGETVQIIDGDIYIDGNIARKPQRVQEELWMPVYDNDFQPIAPMQRRFNSHAWQQPFRNRAGSKWKIAPDDPTVFRLEDSGDSLSTMVYDTKIGNDFRATYAYDDPRQYDQIGICSDLMIRFHVRAAGSGLVGASLSKYGIEYRGMIDAAGRMYIERIAPDGQVAEIAGGSCEIADPSKPAVFSFANVDHQLVLTFAGNKLKYDLGSGVNDAGEIRANIEPMAAFHGKGKLELLHVAIFRDIHYGDTALGGKPILQGSLKKPLTLGDDEFFACGDNSPVSLDGRFWGKPGIGNNGKSYRQGVVPRDYLVGKAFLLYWPGPQRISNGLPIIPYPGDIKIIAGGSDKRL